MTREAVGLLVLRLGLATVFLWFGFSQLVDGINWVSIVPDWAVQLFRLPPAMIVLANGLFEVVFGALLAMGFKVRHIAFAFALHLVPIIVTLGPSPSGVRDFGLCMAALALGLLATPTRNYAHQQTGSA